MSLDTHYHTSCVYTYAYTMRVVMECSTDIMADSTLFYLLFVYPYIIWHYLLAKMRTYMDLFNDSELKLFCFALGSGVCGPTWGQWPPPPPPALFSAYRRLALTLLLGSFLVVHVCRHSHMIAPTYLPFH